VDVVVLPQDEFMTLAQGYRDLGSALKARMTERMTTRDRFVAAQKTTEWI
jgi:hypothetical protein